MSSDPSEPENFTLEQMMERLKERSENDKPDGEWVTRADGSQAYKVRRRRRRSHQPQKDAAEQLRRMRAVQIVGVGLVLAALAALFAGVMVYVNTSAYREQRLALLSQWTGAKAEVMQLRVMPTSAHMAQLDLKWTESHALRSLVASQIKAELRPTSLISKVWHGGEMLAQDARVQIDRSTAEAVASPAPQGEVPFQFQNFRTPKLQLVMGSPSAPALTLQDGEAAYRYNGQSGIAELTLNRGKLALAGWQPLQVDRALFQFAPERMEVVNLYLIDPLIEQGSMLVSGSVALHSAQPSSLKVKVERACTATLLSPGVAELFNATMATDDRRPEVNSLTFVPGDMASHQLNLSLQSEAGTSVTLGNWPGLKQLAQVIQEPWYERPGFESIVTATLVRKGGTISLQQIHALAKNRIAVKGSLSVDAQQKLSGTLEIGLPREIIVASGQEELLNEVFSDSRDGMRWAMVKLGGTVQQPHDDLATRLIKISQHAQPQSPAHKSPLNPNEQRFQDLTR